MPKDPDKNTEEGFLSRWSRRKVETVGPPETSVIGDIAGPQPKNVPERIGSEQTKATKVILTDEHMPPIETLTADGDFSGFLSPGVSEGLRKLALRKLFSSAVFNIRDGLDDYDDDFRNFAGLGDLITSDMKHQMELEEERKRSMQEDTQPTVAENQESTPDETQASDDPQVDDPPKATKQVDTESP